MAEPERLTVEELFARDYVRLVRALAVTHGVDAARDAVQDAFVTANLRWAQVGCYDDPAGWLRRVAINNLRKAARDDARRSAILDRFWPRSPAPAGDDRSAGSRTDLQVAVRRLPRRQREAVALYYLADLPIAEVAIALGVSTGTVKSNLHEARRNLRAALGDAHEHTTA